ncbi:hypothetical protein [Kocuria nitroreducens]|uniref:hypothetical protein n=1 Tax=Kocuria nitroreducens TaxID=3058914 RepID=UPI0036DADA73
MPAQHPEAIATVPTRNGSHRFPAKPQADAVAFHSPSVPSEHTPRSNPSWWGEPPTPQADELPDGVDDLSPEARRTLLDLLRALVVTESGGGPR